MTRHKITLFQFLLLIGLLSFVFSSRALADLTIVYPTSGEAFGSEIILNPEADGLTEATLELQLLDAEQVIERRLTQLDIPQPYQVTRYNEQLVVTLPEGSDTPYVNSILAHVGEIEFIDGGQARPPLGQHITTTDQTNPDKNVYQTLFSGQEVESVLPPDPTTGQIFYQMALSKQAAKNFAEFAHTRSGNYVCIVMDQEVIGCSAMYYWADGTLEILPNLRAGSVVSFEDLTIFLQSGPLPIPLEIQY